MRWTVRDILCFADEVDAVLTCEGDAEDHLHKLIGLIEDTLLIAGGGRAGNARQEYRTMQEGFLYTTKLWFAVHESSVIEVNETGRRRLKDVFHIATLDTRGKKAFAAFTDEDLAERFLEALGDPEMVPLATRTPDALIELLENLQRSGCSLVAFDPMPKPVFVPLETVLKDVRREID